MFNFDFSSRIFSSKLSFDNRCVYVENTCEENQEPGIGWGERIRQTLLLIFVETIPGKE